jgi:hypothetical protein
MATQRFSSIYNYSATVTAYDANTKIVTLDTPVNISMGPNETFGTITSQYSLTGTIVNIAKAIQQGTNPPKLSTDEAGNFVGIFNVPTTRFQTGQRVFRIDNRTIPTDPATATTFSEATFTASGLATKSQQLNFSPSVDSSASTFTQVNQRSTTTITKTTSFVPFPPAPDPVAQTFIISKDNYPNGMYAKSVKLFFYSKPTTNTPIKISIVGTLNGYPNGQKLDHSTVVLTPDQVLTSKTPHYLDSTTYTEFVFEAPVYIQPGFLYAIIVEANSPDYVLYFAQQNKIAVPSTAKEKPTDANPTNPTKIGVAPYVGALFESQNGITWTADQTKDLMFVMDKCVFDITAKPQISFVVPKNLPYRKLGIDDILHKVDANSVSNLYGNYSTNLNVDAINLSTTDFVPTGTDITYQYNSTLALDGSSSGVMSVSPGKLGSPTPDNIYLNDGKGERLLDSSSSNSFSLFATLSSTDPNLSPIISDDGTSLYTISYIVNNMGIGNNVISLASGGSGYTGVNTSISISAPDVGSDRAVLGFTANSGVITNVYTVYEGSGYLKTPTVTITDTAGSNASVIIYGETGSTGGNSYARYFTKKVILTPGNDSGDLRVYYTAYKPLGTGVYVYYKILNRNDTQKFEDGNWQLMTELSNGNVYSSSRSNLIEYECAPGTNGKADNYISYTSTSGVTYTSFSQFAIKIVFATNDKTNVPFLTDIRALALPPGTGI